MKIKAQLPRRLALLLAILTLASAVLVGCGKTTDDDPTPVDPKDDEGIVKPEPVEVPVDFAAAQKKWPDGYACIRIPGATRCAISDEMGVPSWCAVSLDRPTQTLFCSAFLVLRTAKYTTSRNTIITSSWM